MMNFRLFLVLMAASIFSWSCSDSTLTDFGSSIQPAGDLITVNSDTFHLSSENYFVESVVVKPDTFLLGSFYDTKYGTTFADILAQVDYPLNHVFHEGCVGDSVALVMFFDNWFGDMYSPMEVSVYEMNKSTFSYTGVYPSNIKVSDYCDKTLLIGKKAFTPSDFTNSRLDTTMVVVNLNNEFLNRFTSFDPSTYSSDANFLNHFKGMYITPSFGSAAMLYVNEMFLEFYYHYNYTSKTESGNDTIITVKNAIKFPANSYFRQVNRIVHPDTAQIAAQLQLPENKFRNFLSTPANIGTKLNLPLKRIADKINTSGKKLNFNGGILKIYIDSLDEENISQPVPSKLMLIRESSAERFFANDELPSDTVAILSARGSDYISETGTYDNYYYFNISGILSDKIKASDSNNKVFAAESDLDNMLLVPVDITYNSSGSITKVKHLTSMSAISLCSANHPEKPMRIELIYSGF